MALEAIRRLAGLGESVQREFKRSTGERKEVTKSLCAMLNGGGGTVLIGVHDDGTIVGQQVNAATQADIAAELARVEPAALPTFEVLPFAGDRSVIALTVPGGGGPFMYEGRSYIRVGPTTRAMPKAQYDLLMLECLHGSHRWENQPARGVTPADLDAAEIRRTIDEAVRRGRMDDPGTREIAELLRGLQLMRDGAVLNAAMVLFGLGEALLPDYPQCVLRLALPGHRQGWPRRRRAPAPRRCAPRAPLPSRTSPRPSSRTPRAKQGVYAQAPLLDYWSTRSAEEPFRGHPETGEDTPALPVGLPGRGGRARPGQW